MKCLDAEGDLIPSQALDGAIQQRLVGVLFGSQHLSLSLSKFLHLIHIQHKGYKAMASMAVSLMHVVDVSSMHAK